MSVRHQPYKMQLTGRQVLHRSKVWRGSSAGIRIVETTSRTGFQSNPPSFAEVHTVTCRTHFSADSDRPNLKPALRQGAAMMRKTSSGLKILSFFMIASPLNPNSWLELTHGVRTLRSRCTAGGFLFVACLEVDRPCPQTTALELVHPGLVHPGIALRKRSSVISVGLDLGTTREPYLRSLTPIARTV